MLNTLYGRLVLVLCSLGAAMVIIVVLALNFSLRTYHLDVTQRLNYSLASNLIAGERLFPADSELDLRMLLEKFRHLQSIHPEIDLYYLDRSGRILASSSTPLKRESVDIAPLQRFLDGTAAFPILGDDPRALSMKQVFSAAPLRIKGVAGGYLYVIVHPDEHSPTAQQLKRGYAMREGMWITVGGILFAILASLAIVHLVTRPLRRLTHAIDQFQKSDFTTLPTTGGGTSPLTDSDIGRLHMTFEKMAERISALVRELKQRDDTRREFIANISHDLRTPLASLRGHLETVLLKDSYLSGEDKRRYLEIAATQAESLSKLTYKLFELARLDDPQAVVTRETFPLNDLVQDVVKKFEIAAERKNISLTAEIPAELPLVRADIYLMERVLDNLIENALFYTGNGGAVSVRLSLREGHVEVSVSDTGRGIKTEDLPRIFDRFYRGEKSRNRSAEHGGLGLAIVKRILELHETDIDVKSTLGKGTTFTFKLPQA